MYFLLTEYVHWFYYQHLVHSPNLQDAFDGKNFIQLGQFNQIDEQKFV